MEKKLTIVVDLCTLKINSSTFKFIPIQWFLNYETSFMENWSFLWNDTAFYGIKQQHKGLDVDIDVIFTNFDD